MKAKIILLFVLYVITIPQLLAQKDNISMAGILSSAGEYVELIEKEYGQEIVRMEFDIIQDTKETFRYLTDDYEYGILAFGDYRIKDIDVKVYKYVNDQWTLIKKDEEEAAAAYITVKPPFTARYLIEIKAYSFNEGYDGGHYGLIVFHP